MKAIVKNTPRVMPLPSFVDKLGLSNAKRDKLQAAVIKEFAPRFLKSPQVLYVSSAKKKERFIDKALCASLKVPVSNYNKLPDIILFDTKKKWLYLIETVTARGGAMNAGRISELKKMFSKSGHGLIFVSAFPGFTEFNQHLRKIAWETVVWLADFPEHRIHFNGDKFLGPSK